MGKFRILNIEPDGYCDAARDILRQVAIVDEEIMGRAELLRRIAQYDVLITRLAHHIDDAVLAAGKRLKAVASATTGRDHFDLEAAHRRGVVVLSLAGETEFLDTITATAEHSWTLILALTRNLVAAHGSVLAGTWDRDRFRGRDLAGRTLGVVGYGRVGRQVTRIAKAFDMTVLAYDPHVHEASVELTGSLEELLRRASIVTLHAPLSAMNQGMIGARELRLMAADALLINTSRGALVDEAALLVALEEARIGGAALDVLIHEQHFPSATARRLLAYAKTKENLIITPHISGATHESMARTEIFMAQKINRFLAE